MATVTEKPRVAVSLVESQRKVRDPLHRLRKYIRRYVLTEAITALVISLAAVFWVGLIIDYGAFKLLGIDLVQDLPRWFRALLLGAGLLAVFFFVELRKVLRVQVHPEVEVKTGAAGLLVRVLDNRSLLAAVATPLLVLYFAVWVVLALWRDAGTLGALGMGVIVAALIVGFTALIVLKRFLYEFRDPALALVLERRYPQLLGDRLITAVELSNPREAAKYGYSAAMIEHVIHEAAEQVGKLPVREVFDWKRLYKQAALAVLLTAVAYAAAGFGMVGLAALDDEEISPQGGFHRLHDVSAIWFERNVLLENERWPKKAQVEMISPAAVEHKMGKGTTPPELRVRALEYVIADGSTVDGWRALTLADLRTRPELGVRDVPSEDEIPSGWKPRDPALGLSVDEVKLRLEKTRDDSLSDDAYAKLRGVLDQIDQRVRDQAMSRTLRKLRLPAEVIVKYWGKTKRGTVTLQRIENNEYKGKIEELTESIEYDLRAEDYVSDPRKITVVPPPTVRKLEKYEAQPAYLYYLSPDGDDEGLLLGEKQRIGAVEVSVVGAEKPDVEIPHGSDVRLVAQTDKPLDPDSVRLDPLGAASLRGIQPKVTGEYTFEVSFPNVRSEVSFRLLFTDTDGVPGSQDLRLVPREDARPVVSQGKPVVVRMVGDRYVITPNAIIPFSLVINDDRGLTAIDYVFRISEMASPVEGQRRAARAAAGVGVALAGPGAPLLAKGYHLFLPATMRQGSETVEGRFALPHFKARIDARRRATLLSDIEKNLARQLDPRNLPEPLQKTYIAQELQDIGEYLTDHDVEVPPEGGGDPSVKGFDVTQIELKDPDGFTVPLKAGRNQVQKTYLMQLAVEAADTNLHREGRGRSSPRREYPFLIVSETELLYHINQEEKALFDELNRTFNELVKAREVMTDVRYELPLPGAAAAFDANRLASLSVRVEAVQKTLQEALRITTKINSDYERILVELRTNRVETPNYIDRVRDKIVRPLGKIRAGTYPMVPAAGGDPINRGFTHTRSAFQHLRRMLDTESENLQERLGASRKAADSAHEELDHLIRALNTVLLEMEGIVALGELIAKLRELERKSHDSLDLIEEYRRYREEEILRSLGIDPDKK